MKKGKKILSVVMAVCIMAASVMGCSGKTPADAKTQDETPAEITTEETTQETAQDTTAGTDSYKVGLEIWSTDDALGGHTKQIIEEFGKLWNMELIVHTSDYASEAQIKSIEDFIAAEVDGIIAVPCDEDTTVLMAEKCQEAGIPLVLAYRNVVDEGNIAKLEGNTSFIAEIENGAYMMGYHMVQQIIDDGYTKIALIDTPKGNANDISFHSF